LQIYTDRGWKLKKSTKKPIISLQILALRLVGEVILFPWTRRYDLVPTLTFLREVFEMKNVRAVLLVAAMVFGLAFAGMSFVNAEENGDYANGQDRTVTIFHTNDIHGRFVRGMAYNAHAETIGLQYVASVVAATENALLLDAGDTLHGTPFTVFSEGLDPVRLMNAAGYSFMAPGNHDFNFGLDRLLDLEQSADFGILAANVFWRSDSSLVFTPYTTLEVNGILFGFFGLATQDTPVTTKPSNIVDVYFGCYIEASETSVAALQELGVDVVVAISHVGYHPIQELAAAVTGIDLIVDGHSHTELPEGLWVGDTLIVQAWEWLRRLGVVTVTISPEGELSLDATLLTADDIVGVYEACEDMLALAAAIEAEFYEQTRVVVAYTPVRLEHTHELVRTVEMPIANLVADAFRWASDADIALMNGGAIRDYLEAGDITIGDLLRVLPFINYLVVVEMTPAVLFDALENGVSRWPTESGNGRFLQVSGIAYTFDAFAPVGERVLSVTFGGEELSRTDTTTVFTVAITNFKAEGGDGFDMFEDLYVVFEGDVKNMVFIDFLNSDYADVAGASVEGRLVQVGEEAPEAEEVIEEIVVEAVEIADVVVVELEYVEGLELAVVVDTVVEIVEIIVEPTPVPAPAPAPVLPVGNARVNTTALYVRGGAGVAHDPINHLLYGSVVVIHETVNLGGHVWARITSGDVTGWVYTAFLD
jgi:5'-nucleotidase